MDRSLLQNEVLFTSEGLTLLALDHLYTFKCALQSYAKTQSPCRLEDAVDELRRLVLGNEMRNLRKSTLTHNYTWLGRPDGAALQDVGRMYHRAYGSHEGDKGIDNDMDLPSWPLPDTRLSLHNVPLVQDQDAGPVVLEQHLHRFSFEDLTGKPLPKTPVGVQDPLEIEVRRSRSQVRSTTPKQRTPTHSNASRNSGTPGRRKSPPAALNIESSSRAESPLRSGFKTPASTVTEQSDTGHSVVSNLTTQSERAATPMLDRWGEEKEFLGMEIELDMDEIEDWYREVDINLDTVTFKPARAAIYIQEPTPEVEEIRQAVVNPVAEPLPQPPPLPSTMAKVGLMGLRLDTQFIKPKPRVAAKRHQVSVSMDAAVRMSQPHDSGPTSLAINLEDLHTNGDGDDTEEELTARPPDSAHPATDGLRGFVRWNSISIDSVLSPVEGPGDRDAKVGPMTPNGYDDISPITRGEWGFLMGADRKNGRQVNVTECL
ncbi:hypothetical protein GQ53DRAFT_746945 [Thozetella sp. PMI_491]|nr:hypothetical protein GQ53DRAFT_746945 [Thozetella sp. PMI_491]